MLTNDDLLELVRTILDRSRSLPQSETSGDIECPFCIEKIKARAKKCKHCGEWVMSKDEITEQESPYVSSTIGQRVKKIIVEYLRVDASKITDNARFYEDLSCSDEASIDLEDRFFYEFEVEFLGASCIFDDMPTVKDMICFIQQKMDDKAKGDEVYSNEKKDDLIRQLQRTPLIGKITAKALVDLGILSNTQLAAQDPKLLCARIAKLWGKPVGKKIKFNIAYAIAWLQVVEKHPELHHRDQDVLIERLMIQKK